MSEMTGDPAAAAHYCSACGKPHSGDDGNAAVEIARINRRADVEIARIERGAFQQTEREAETEIAVTEINAAAAVEIAGEMADAGPAEPEGDPETTAIVVEGPPAETEGEPEPSIMPPEESTVPEAEPKSRSRGYWP